MQTDKQASPMRHSRTGKWMKCYVETFALTQLKDANDMSFAVCCSDWQCGMCVCHLSCFLVHIDRRALKDHDYIYV